MNAPIDQRAARLHNCACLADADGESGTAVAMYRRALAISPGRVETMVGLGLLLWARGDVVEAEDLALRSLEVEPTAWAHCLVGRLRTGQGRLDEAARAFDCALMMDSLQPERVMDVATANFHAGRWCEAWPLYTAANRANYLHAQVPSPTFRRWDGTEMRDKDLLVVARLGFGDQALLSRFLPWARARVRSVTVLCNPLEESLYDTIGLGSDVRVVSYLNRPYDVWVENFALPELSGCTQSDALSFSSACARCKRLAGEKSLGGPVKVALAWSGSDDSAHNAIRRVPFKELLSLAADPRLHLYSFQTGRRAVDVAAHRAQVLVKDMSREIEWDWRLTARALAEVDVVVAPDCGLSHFAASLGVPTYVMLSAYPSWHWGVTGSVSLWYPWARLFRQRRLGDWAPVVVEVGRALGELASGLAGPFAEASAERSAA